MIAHCAPFVPASFFRKAVHQSGAFASANSPFGLFFRSSYIYLDVLHSSVIYGQRSDRALLKRWCASRISADAGKVLNVSVGIFGSDKFNDFRVLFMDGFSADLSSCDAFLYVSIEANLRFGNYKDE